MIGSRRDAGAVGRPCAAAKVRPVNSATWSYPTEVRFGPGRISEVAEACRSVGIKRPLVITDPGLVALQPVQAVTSALSDGQVDHEIFTRLRPNPVSADVSAGVEAFRSGDHDGVVAIGGGSPLDVGKLVAFMAAQTRPIFDFEDIDDNWTLAHTEPIVPVVAIPTTAGTGSEVGRAGVVIDESANRKVIVYHPAMLPRIVIADPILTLDLPRVLTVGTGLDALSHNLEAVCAPTLHPMSHGIGLEGCRLVLENLPVAAAQPHNLEARGQMLISAAMGAVAFQKGLGAMHALAHPIGALFNTHHGMTNAVVMPYVLAANRRAIEPTIEKLAAYVGISGGFEGFLAHIVELREALDVPETLIELGVDPAAISEVCAAAVVDPSAAGNPVSVDRDYAEAVFDAACHGRIDA